MQIENALKGVRYIPYRKEHALSFGPLLAENKNIRDHDHYERWAELNENSLMAVTFIDDDGSPLACLGVTLIWPGVAWVWFTASEEARRFAKLMAVLGRPLMQSLQLELGIRRLQCTTGCPITKRFAEHVGFHVEGVLEAYGPDGGSQYMMARIEYGTERPVV